MKRVVVLLMCLSVYYSVVAQIQVVLADNPAFTYSGRFDFTNPQEVRYDWPGTSIGFQFKGKSLEFLIDGGERNYFNVFIDDELHEVMHVPNDTVYPVNDIKGKGWHTCRLQKRTEGEMGTVIFKGVRIASNAGVKAVNSIPKRKIEFIGNSITCGYGTEGASKDEDFLPQTENVNRSYAFITARAFDAECYVTAHSGLGVVRNYGDKEKISTKLTTMPDRYNQVLDMDSTLEWDFNKWQPDMVVINLGTNDYSTNIEPDPYVFKHRYSEFISELRAYYGDIPVFCVSGPMRDEPASSYIKDVVESIRVVKGDKNLYFIRIPGFLLNNTTDLGSDWHPSYRGQLKMARHIIPCIANVMKWDYSNEAIGCGSKK